MELQPAMHMPALRLRRRTRSASPTLMSNRNRTDNRVPRKKGTNAFLECVGVSMSKIYKSTAPGSAAMPKRRLRGAPSAPGLPPLPKLGSGPEQRRGRRRQLHDATSTVHIKASDNLTSGTAAEGADGPMRNAGPEAPGAWAAERALAAGSKPLSTASAWHPHTLGQSSGPAGRSVGAEATASLGAPLMTVTAVTLGAGPLHAAHTGYPRHVANQPLAHPRAAFHHTSTNGTSADFLAVPSTTYSSSSLSSSSSSPLLPPSSGSSAAPTADGVAPGGAAAAAADVARPRSLTPDRRLSERARARSDADGKTDPKSDEDWRLGHPSSKPWNFGYTEKKGIEPRKNVDIEAPNHGRYRLRAKQRELRPLPFAVPPGAAPRSRRNSWRVGDEVGDFSDGWNTDAAHAGDSHQHTELTVTLAHLNLGDGDPSAPIASRSAPNTRRGSRSGIASAEHDEDERPVKSPPQAPFPPRKFIFEGVCAAQAEGLDCSDPVCWYCKGFPKPQPSP